MQEYGFSLTRILRFCPYTGECGSVKTRILAYFMQCLFNRNDYVNSIRSVDVRFFPLEVYFCIEVMLG